MRLSYARYPFLAVARAQGLPSFLPIGLQADDSKQSYTAPPAGSVSGAGIAV
jgi:hypothetical protein